MQLERVITTVSKWPIDGTNFSANNFLMSVLHYIRFACVALLCLGLTFPASLLAGCCGCCQTNHKSAGKQANPIAKTCCAGKVHKAAEVSPCQLDSPCRITWTCASCQGYQPVMIGEKQAPQLLDLVHQPLALAWDVSIPASTIHEVTADTPLDSHNARQSRIGVWRK